MIPAKSFVILCALLLGSLTLAGCTNLNTTEERMLSGAAIGAGAGAATTVVTGGCISCGAVVGGAIGAGAGYVVDKIEKNK